MKKIYVFDMGHVILKSSNLKGMYLESGAECNYADFKNLFYHSQEANEVYSGVIDDDAFFGILKERSGIAKSVEELKLLYIKYKGSIYRETLNIIKRLKEEKNKVCLLSNLKVIDYTYLSSVMDVKLFDQLFLSYVMGVAKPDIQIYEQVIVKLGTNDFYFFDDTKENVESALKLGIKVFQVTGDTIEECFSKKILSPYKEKGIL